MNFKHLLLCSSLAQLLLSVAVADGTGSHDHKMDPNAVAATVNGKPIAKMTANRVAQQIAARGEQADPKRILEELINLELLTQEAEKIGLDKEPEVATALSLQYTQTMANAYLARISETIEISDEEIREEYDRQAANITTSEYNAAHILLESEADAIAVIEQLEKGSDFVALAKEKSTGPSGPNGGDLGWFQGSNMVPEFAQAVSEMQTGDVSTKPVKTQFGWHVIQLNETRGAAKPDFDSVRAGLFNTLMREKLAATVDSIRNTADVAIK